MLRLYSLTAPGTFHPALLLAPVLPHMLASVPDEIELVNVLQACHSAIAAAAASECPALTAEVLHGIQQVMLASPGSASLHSLQQQHGREQVRSSFATCFTTRILAQGCGSSLAARWSVQAQCYCQLRLQ